MASQFFTNLENSLKKDGEAFVKKINGIYQFNITADGATKVYSVDLYVFYVYYNIDSNKKTGSGSVKTAAHEKPDCTITMAESDFNDILAGKLTEQTAFMKKKLSLKGSMPLAMKFRLIVNKVKQDTASTPAASTATTTTAAAPSTSSLDDGTPLGRVFANLSKAVASKPELVKSVNGIYLFNIATSSGEKAYTVDLKTGKGSVSSGAPAKADCTISIKEEDFLALMAGKVNGQALFGQGKLKIKGGMGLAMKLGQLTKALPKANL
eukprot:gene5246-6528_t